MDEETKELLKQIVSLLTAEAEDRSTFRQDLVEEIRILNRHIEALATRQGPL